VRSMQPHPASDVHPFSVPHGHFDFSGEGNGAEISVQEMEPCVDDEHIGSRLARDESRMGGKALR
jgi:hypothetical protein